MGAPEEQLQLHRSYYKILGVSVLSTEEDIKQAYKRLALRWHPDRHGNEEAATHRFQQIQEAYAVLSNPAQRDRYDLQYLDVLNVEEYLKLFQQFILTANGLTLQSAHQQHAAWQAQPDEWRPLESQRSACLLTAM